MKLSRVLIPFILACLPAAAQPVINGVANAASFAVGGLPNADIALGSMFVIFGTGLGPSTLTQVSSFPLPTSQGLAGTSVHINTASFAGQADAIMIYTSATQVAAIVPSSLNFTGTVILTVTYNGRTSSTFFMRLTNNTFGTFTVSQTGVGSAVAQNYNSDSDEPFNSLATPAKPGQLVILWGTGLGPVKGAENQGPLPGQMNLPLQTYVGGKQAQLSYYGRSGCCSGIDQVVFAVPDGVLGCTVPVDVVINGIPSNTATISVSPDGSPCSDPLGTSSSDIQTLAGKGTTRIASLSLSHTDGGNPSDTAGATFAAEPFAQYAASLSGVPAAGSCYVISGSGNANFPPSPATALDAGAALQFSGPNGNAQLTKLNTGGYGALVPAIQAGAYTLTGPGGKDVGPFSASLTVPAPMTWTNRTALTSITPGTSFAVNWTAGDPNGYIEVIGAAASNTLFAIFVCTEHANLGTFTVPGYITAAFPVGQGVVGLSQSGAPATFAASGIDQGYFTYASGSGLGPIPVGSSSGGGKK